MLAEPVTIHSRGNPVAAEPLVRELPGDLETPVGVYMKLRGGGPSFLLESVEGGERVARYSFVGVNPSAKYTLRGSQVEVAPANGLPGRLVDAGRNPLAFLESETLAPPTALSKSLGVSGGPNLRGPSMGESAGSPESQRLGPGAEGARSADVRGWAAEQPADGSAKPAFRPQLPRFVGGLVGYLGYESVRYFEPRLAPHLKPAREPDGIFLLADTLVAFDHARRSLFLIAHPLDGNREAAQRRLDALELRLRAPLPALPARPAGDGDGFRSNMKQSDFEAMVRAAKELIAAGDIFQVVLSQRLQRRTSAPSFEIYRALRRLNPSPYMFYFDFGEVDGQPFHLVGASPEMFVRLEGRRASLRPIAGTRPRGASPEADLENEHDLSADAKERAEHVMLVDLGRNDLGRVCDYGTVTVPASFVVERYSHVMHLVSQVEGNLRAGMTAFDLAAATFPAGTVSGAPKVRAMEIIADLEPIGRGPHAGAIGYFSFDGAMDTCITIRTLVAHGDTVSVQAGAGIVADSDPTREFHESVNKAKALMAAVEAAER
jgi:anthranilate synthase component 1